jgi:hypothetical protein
MLHSTAHLNHRFRNHRELVIGFNLNGYYSSARLSIRNAAFVILAEAGIQRRRPVMGRGLNKHETPTLHFQVEVS